jgi:transcriptional regulator with GAF, ATPase, and Fis domain
MERWKTAVLEAPSKQRRRDVMTSAWIHSAGRDSESAALDLTSELGRAGVETRGRGEGEATAGVILQSAVTADSIQLVRDLSRGGRDRVAVVDLERAGTPGSGWALLRAGAADVIPWCGARMTAALIAARLSRWDAVERTVRSPLVRENLVGSSPAWTRAIRDVVEVAVFTDAPVLLLGESGTGKELVARLVHALDARADKRELVLLDCTTMVAGLAGSEFFGHERGAFTGASGARQGAFALADGGTLFLDEVGDLPLGLQAQILRVVQEKTYKRVGGNAWQQTRFRLVCATNADLTRAVAEGHFRGDLYYRIAGAVCRLPPLRERREDIVPLARHFLERMRAGTAAPEFADAVRDRLVTRDYPGNVRDLYQLIVRMGHHHVGDGPITVGDLPEEEWPVGDASEPPRESDALVDAVRSSVRDGMGLREIGRFAADTAVRVAIEEAEGNLQVAARRLGVTDRALQIRRAETRGS